MTIDHVRSAPAARLRSIPQRRTRHRDDTLFLKSIAIRTAETSLAVDGAVEQYLSEPVLKLKVTSIRRQFRDRESCPWAGIALQPAFELGLNGPLDRLGVE
jgi:hypothetical protein